MVGWCSMGTWLMTHEWCKNSSSYQKWPMISGSVQLVQLIDAHGSTIGPCLKWLATELRPRSKVLVDFAKFETVSTAKRTFGACQRPGIPTKKPTVVVMVIYLSLRFIDSNLLGGLEHEFYDFPYIGNNHPNWRTHIFQGGRYHQPVIDSNVKQYVVKPRKE